jgi:plasmid stability protein
VSNLTVAIEDDLLREARIKAVKDGTSVNEVCRKAIEAYVGRTADAEQRVARLRATFALAKRPAPGTAAVWEGREPLYGQRLDALERRRQRKP